MFGKLFQKWIDRSFDKEATEVLAALTNGSLTQRASVVGIAAMLRHQMTNAKPEFRTLLDSMPGENEGPISMWIMELNRLIIQLGSSGNIEEMNGMYFWKITFKAMIVEAIRPKGFLLWGIARECFPLAREWIEEKLDYERHAESPKVFPLEQALLDYTFVPRLFR